MKKILLFLMIVVSVSAKGQMQPEYEVGYYRPFTLVPAYTYIAQSYIWVKAGTDSVFHVPAGTTATLRTGGWKRTGAVFYDSTGVDSGFYVYGSGGVWQRLARAAEIATLGWGVTGNSGTVDGTNFIGTTDNIPFNIRVNNERAGRIHSDGVTVLGYQAVNGNPAIVVTAIGYQAGFSFTTGAQNTLVGYQAMTSATGGVGNTAVGFEAMEDGTTPAGNTAIGNRALRNITNGTNNTAIGMQSMDVITTGFNNVAVGFKSLFANVSGDGSVAIGDFTLNAATGNDNIAIGTSAGSTITTGSNNITIGSFSGRDIITGNSNIIFDAGGSIIGDINNTIIFKTIAGERFRVDSAGNFGILNATPTQALDVTGNVRFSGALMPNNTAGASGQVLTSAGAGAVPTWTTPSAGGGTPAGNFGNIQINRNGAFAAPGSDSLDFESATGLTAKGNITALIGQFQQGGVAGITNGYLRTNSTNLASTTDLNPGVALYGGGAGVAVYGFDLGYNATSARYRNRMFMFGTSADIAFSATNDTPPTAQSGFTDLVVIRGDSGNMGIGVLSPTGVLHLKAGTVAANTAPIKFTSGTILGTIEAGAKEYNNAHYETTAALNRVATGGAIKDFLITADNSGTGETDLFTYTTKASTLAVDGEKLIFNIGGTFNDLTATAQLQFYFGGTSIGNTGALTVSAIGGWSANIFIIRTSSTTVRALVAVTTPGASTAVYTTQTDLTGLTLSGTNIIKVTGTAAGASGGSGDISAKLGTIFWYGAVSN